MTPDPRDVRYPWMSFKNTYCHTNVCFCKISIPKHQKSPLGPFGRSSWRGWPQRAPKDAQRLFKNVSKEPKECMRGMRDTQGIQKGVKGSPYYPSTNLCKNRCEHRYRKSHEHTRTINEHIMQKIV